MTRLLSYSLQIPARLLIMKIDKTRNVFFEMAAIADAAGPSLSDALPGLHAVTGCDSTSAGRGKKYPLKLCQADSAACQSMGSFGLAFDSGFAPCQDALRSHTMRANYQAAIWRNALVAIPKSHLLRVMDGSLQITISRSTGCPYHPLLRLQWS